MSTDKQIEYVEKLAAWKGKAIDFNNIKEKSVEEVSTLIDELKALPSVKAEKPAAKQAEPSRNNKIRFGLACKLAAQRTMNNAFVPNQEDFNSLAKKYYDLMNNAEAEILTSSSEVAR